MISLMIANQLGYAEDDLLNLGLGTLLHDVGKLLVPKSILEKPGALSEAEMMIIKQHCDLGISSIERFDLPKAALDLEGAVQELKRMGDKYPQEIITVVEETLL